MTSLRFFPIDHPESVSADHHIIHPEKGHEMIAALGGEPLDFHSLKYRLQAIMALAEVPGIEGIGLYPAHDGDHSTIVIYALDKNGDRITDGAVAIENGERCPPLC